MPGQQGAAASLAAIVRCKTILYAKPIYYRGTETEIANDRFSKINEGFMIGSPHLPY